MFCSCYVVFWLEHLEGALSLSPDVCLAGNDLRSSAHNNDLKNDVILLLIDRLLRFFTAVCAQTRDHSGGASHRRNKPELTDLTPLAFFTWNFIGILSKTDGFFRVCTELLPSGL